MHLFLFEWIMIVGLLSFTGTQKTSGPVEAAARFEWISRSSGASR